MSGYSNLEGVLKGFPGINSSYQYISVPCGQPVFGGFGMYQMKVIGEK